MVKSELINIIIKCVDITGTFLAVPSCCLINIHEINLHLGRALLINQWPEQMWYNDSELESLSEIMLSFGLCTCLINISSYNDQTVHIPHCDGADLDERDSTQSTCDTQRPPVLPDEWGQHSQSAAALTGASVHEGSSTAAQNITTKFKSGAT